VIKFIIADEYLQNLVNAGIIPEETGRVVIDARAGNPVYIYVMQYGTEELLRVGMPEGEIVVEIVNGK